MRPRWWPPNAPALGHPHATLRWHWDGQGNLQDAARRARLALIDRWRGGLAHVLFAHTQDDVAETFLMRLARGSGVEGLSAMAERRLVRAQGGDVATLSDAEVTQTAPPPPAPQGAAPGFQVIRPLLGEGRAGLRHFAQTLNLPFVDDPSNADPRFDRARARAALAQLGIDAADIAATARRLARARDALAARARSVAEEVARADDLGVLRFDRDGFADVERDTQLRLLAAGLQWVAGAEYRPRAAPLEALLDRALAGGGGTLHGAQVEVTRAHIEIFREYAPRSRGWTFRGGHRNPLGRALAHPWGRAGGHAAFARSATRAGPSCRFRGRRRRAMPSRARCLPFSLANGLSPAPPRGRFRIGGARRSFARPVDISLQG